MTCDSLECYYESKRVERRIRRLRALADGYKDRLNRERFNYMVMGENNERARIVAKLNALIDRGNPHGCGCSDYECGIGRAIDAIEGGES